MKQSTVVINAFFILNAAILAVASSGSDDPPTMSPSVVKSLGFVGPKLVYLKSRNSTLPPIFATGAKGKNMKVPTMGLPKKKAVWKTTKSPKRRFGKSTVNPANQTRKQPGFRKSKIVTRGPKTPFKTRTYPETDDTTSLGLNMLGANVGLPGQF